MGPQRSGKTSISKVLFSKMSPHETLFLEPTSSLSIKLVANNPFVQFEVWDFPGECNVSEGVIFEGQPLGPDLIFGGNCAALVFVIDAQDDPATEALGLLHDVVTVARNVNPSINLEVLINKTDGDLFLSEDHKLEVQREVQESVELELEDIASSDTEITLNFYLTSIYDHSIFEAFSKVVHKLIPQLPAMENLLNVFIASCEIEKAFLFDVVSKLYIATDHNPVDISSYELCSEVLDVVVDVSCIYGMDSGEALSPTGASLERTQEAEIHELTDAEMLTKQTSEDARSRADGQDPNDNDSNLEGQKREDMAFDRGSASLIRLSNNVILYLKQVASYLALVCIVRSQSYEKKGIIDYNVEQLRKALEALFTKK